MLDSGQSGIDRRWRAAPAYRYSLASIVRGIVRPRPCTDHPRWRRYRRRRISAACASAGQDDFDHRPFVALAQTVNVSPQYCFFGHGQTKAQAAGTQALHVSLPQ